MADGTKAPKGALIAGLVFILLAFGGCGYGCVSIFGVFGDVADAIDSANLTDLNTATSLRATGENGIVLTSASTARCVVADPSGSEVALEDPPQGTTGSFERDGVTLDLQFVFDTTPGTTYDVFCGDELGNLTGSYLVAPIPNLGNIGGSFGGAIAGVIFFVLGVLFLIIGLVSRSRWKKRNAGTFTGGPPAGGFAAPPAPGGAVPPPPGAAPAPGAAPSLPSMTPPPPAPTPPAAPPAPPAPPSAPPPPSSPPAPGETPPPPPASS
jgi:hypothetical protein